MNEFSPWTQRNSNLPTPTETGVGRLAATWHRLVLWLREPVSPRGLALKRGNPSNRGPGRLREPEAPAAILEAGQVSQRSRKSIVGRCPAIQKSEKDCRETEPAVAIPEAHQVSKSSRKSEKDPREAEAPVAIPEARQVSQRSQKSIVGRYPAIQKSEKDSRSQSESEKDAFSPVYIRRWRSTTAKSAD